MEMPRDHQDALERNRVDLLEMVYLSEEFLDVLLENHTLTSSMVETILVPPTNVGKISRFLDMLPKRGAEAFPTFLRALRETRQHHLVELLDPTTFSSSRPPSQKDIISEHMPETVTQPKDELSNAKKEFDVYSNTDEARFRDASPEWRGTSERQTLYKFDSLSQNADTSSPDVKDISAVIERNDKISMSRDHKDVLIKNRVDLLRTIYLSDEFLAVLQEDYTLTAEMVEEIQVPRTTDGKISKLLEMLPKRGDKAFSTFLRALRETEQDHIVKLLDPTFSLSHSPPEEDVPFDPLTTENMHETAKQWIEDDGKDSSSKATRGFDVSSKTDGDGFRDASSIGVLWSEEAVYESDFCMALGSKNTDISIRDLKLKLPDLKNISAVIEGREFDNVESSLSDGRNKRTARKVFDSPEEKNHKEISEAEKESEAMLLFAWLKGQDWAQSYYDDEDGISLTIHVDQKSVTEKEVIRLINQQFPHLHEIWGVKVTFDESMQFFPSFDTPDPDKKNDVKQVNLLRPGMVIFNARNEGDAGVLSGSLGSGKYAFTTGHFVKTNPCYVYIDDGQQRIPIGEVDGLLLQTVKAVILEKDNKCIDTTADVAFIKLLPGFICKNVLRFQEELQYNSNLPLRFYRLVLYKGQVLKGSIVVTKTPGCAIKCGKIRSTTYSSQGNPDTGSTNVDNEFCITGVDDHRSITKSGDSGSLVMLLPEAGSRILRVIGIVTHGNMSESGATIANRLWNILQVVDKDPDYEECLRSDDTMLSIDFYSD